MTEAAPATGGQGATALRSGAPSATTTTNPNDWTAGLPDEMRGFVQNKGWKDPQSALASYQNLEKAIGAPRERVMVLPEKADDPAWGDVYKRLGVPEKADGYKLPDGIDPSVAGVMTDLLHKANIPASAGEKFLGGMREYFANQVGAANEKFGQESEVQFNQLKEAWGDQFDARIEDARRASSGLGLSEQEHDALERVVGTKRMLSMLQSIGEMMGEQKFRGAGGAGQGRSDFGYTPEQAKARIGELQRDSGWVKKYASGDVEARKELERLNRISLGIGAA